MKPHSVTLVTNRVETLLHFTLYAVVWGPEGGLNIPCGRVVLGPNPDELIEVMRPQDGGVSG